MTNFIIFAFFFYYFCVVFVSLFIHIMINANSTVFVHT